MRSGGDVGRTVDVDVVQRVDGRHVCEANVVNRVGSEGLV